MSAPYQVQFQPYQFPLPFPLVTAHGHWTHRQGIIIQLINERGQTSSGEVAPLPWFGTETLAQATEFCQQLNGWITPDQIQSIGERLPCCQFAFGSAEWGFSDQTNQPQMNYCQLLPTGKAALDYLEKVSSLSCQTVKWKIGVQDFPTEQAWFLQLLAKLPPKTRLRLDANGGLNLTEAKQWLALLDRQRQDPKTTIQIEYLEQPLPPHQLSDLFSLAHTFLTAHRVADLCEIAIDESVANFAQLQVLYDQQWPGIYILKAAIMGDPRRLHHWLTNHSNKAIFSSVF
ncbi:MAG: o-succinylbenzoate synthase [Synechocystis sp.]